MMRSQSEPCIGHPHLRFLCMLVFAAVVISKTSAAGFPDTIFINGKIVTVDSRFRIEEALAISGGVFSAVGTSQEISHLVGPATVVIDLQGKTVVPGFIDAHAHMDREGLKFVLPSMDGVRSIEDILEIIEEEVRDKKPGEWIVTMPIGDYPYFADGPDLLEQQRYPTRWDLDRVSPDNPVYIKGIWYYWSGKSPIVSIANSYALRLAGVTAPIRERSKIRARRSSACAGRKSARNRRTKGPPARADVRSRTV